MYYRGCVKSRFDKIFLWKMALFSREDAKIKKDAKTAGSSSTCLQILQVWRFAQPKSAQIRSIRVISVPLKLFFKREIYRTPRLFT